MDFGMQSDGDRLLQQFLTGPNGNDSQIEHGHSSNQLNGNHSLSLTMSNATSMANDYGHGDMPKTETLMMNYSRRNSETGSTKSSEGPDSPRGHDNELDTEEEKRRKRLERNRISARDSRRRKKQYLELLEEKVAQLTDDIDMTRTEHLDSADVTLTAVKSQLVSSLYERMSLYPPNTNLPPDIQQELRNTAELINERFGPHSKERQAILNYQLQKLDSMLLPPYTRFLLWMSTQDEAFYSRNLNPAPTKKSGEVDRKENKKDSLWASLSAELGLTHEQEERIKSHYRASDSIAAKTERRKIASAVAHMDQFKQVLMDQSKSLQNYIDTIQTILTPDQTIRFQQWAIQNREKYSSGLKHQTNTMEIAMDPILISLLNKAENDFTLDDIDTSKFNTAIGMSERGLESLHITTEHGGGHERCFSTMSSISIHSPNASIHHERSASCLSPSSSSPSSPTRFAPVNCEVHMLVPTSPKEEPFAEHIRVLLKETDSDPSAFQSLRDIYLQTIQPSTSAPNLLKQLHCMPATSAAIANAVQASEESSVIHGAGSGSYKSPLAQKMKQNYHTWKSTFLKSKDDLDPSDGTAPIADILVVFSGDVIPEDFEKIEKSPGGIKADLNRGKRGQFVYLCHKREAPSAFGQKRPPICDITLIYPERGESPPPNYEYVMRRGVPANLNSGASGEKLYMCYKRSASSSISDIAVIFPKKGEKVPYGFMKIDKTPNGHSVDFHTNMEVSICYKKQIGLVEQLKTLWWQSTETKSKEKDGSACDEPVCGKSIEVRDSNSTSEDNSDPMALPRSLSRRDTEADAELTTLIKYLYPLLYSCHLRQGTIAVQAIARLETMLDQELVKSQLMKYEGFLLTAIVETINTSCQQGMRDRLPIVMSILSKVIKQYAHEFSYILLHEVLKALLFINDFDDGVARLTLEELVHSVMDRLEEEKDVNASKLSRMNSMSSVASVDQDIYSPLANIVYGVANDAVTMVEVARMNENALNIIKGHCSIYSTGFCYDIQTCIKPLLQTTAETNIFQLIATLCKYATKRNISTVDQACEKENESIRNTLHVLDATLLCGTTSFKDHHIFGQQIRRFVCSVVNSACVMWSEDVLQSCLNLVTTLWNQYRRHLKVELALLFENVFLRILRSPGSTAGKYQSIVLVELMPWFQLPHNVIEIFLNFDMDRQFVQQWKVFEQFCAVLCSITETSCVNSGPVDVEHESEVGEQSLTTILAILRSLMDASGHAHLILRNDRTRILSMEKGGWELDELSASTCQISETTTTSTDPSQEDDVSPLLHQKISSIYGTVRERNEMQKKSQQFLKRGMEIAETKSFKKALEYLIAMGLIKETPRDITSFLRIYHTFFDESDIGDYLGEGDEEFKLHVRLTYARAISFTGMTLVEALRHYLTHGGFKLPGEAQKIARMVEAFAQCYYEDLNGISSFSSSDTIMILAYSIIMLNTDLHNPQVKKNKMSREQFIKNNRGIDNGNDVPKLLLEDIYDDILLNPIQLKGLSYTINNNKLDYLNNYDIEYDKFKHQLLKSVTQSEDLMKDLSFLKFNFNFFGVDASISPDLVKILFERVWFHFLALSTTILSNNQSDLNLVLQSLDMLRYCISICIFLDMNIERQAFLNQLKKLNTNDLILFEDDWIKNKNNNDPWILIGDLHIYLNKLKDSIEKKQTIEILKSVTKKINRSHIYLHDTTHFIKEGDLIKRCRTGRNRSYRFFLFNDQLLYGDKSISGNYNTHQSLRLRLTRLADIPDSLLVRHAFQILNPVKSFTVFADSHHMKAEWMREIDDAIMEANKKTNRIARRLSTARGQKRENNAAIIAEAKEGAKEREINNENSSLWLFQLEI